MSKNKVLAHDFNVAPTNVILPRICFRKKYTPARCVLTLQWAGSIQQMKGFPALKKDQMQSFYESQFFFDIRIHSLDVCDLGHVDDLMVLFIGPYEMFSDQSHREDLDIGEDVFMTSIVVVFANPANLPAVLVRRVIHLRHFGGRIVNPDFYNVFETV